MRLLILFSTVSCCRMYILEGCYLYCLKGGTKKNFGVLIRSGISDLHVSHFDICAYFCFIPMHDFFLLSQPKRIKKITMLPVKRGRGRPPKFNSAPNSPKPTSPVPNGFAENGKLKKFKYKRFVTMDSPVDEVINFSFYSYCFTWNSIQGSQKFVFQFSLLKNVWKINSLSNNTFCFNICM